jgi:penicillin-binding protein 2
VFKLPNSSHVFHDWWRNGHGRVNLARAITSSCDVYFYGLASRMGIQRMDDILTQFGFGELTGIDMDGELAGIVASPEWKRKNKGGHWYPGDTVNSSIGQGDMQATPIQLAAAVSTLANRGQRFMPYLLLAEQMPGQAYTPQQPIPLDPVKLQDPAYWDIVIHAMQDVVATPQGTAHTLFGKNYTYTIAAKTGTGALSKRRNPNEEDKQENVPEKLRDHHLFIAFAPVDKPTIALAIVTENSNDAIEAARAILDYYLGSQQNVHRQPPTQIKKAGT